MKISITPEAIQDFTERNLPGTVSVGTKNISFNAIARKKLGLTAETPFILEFEDGLLYFLFHPDGFKVQSEMARMSNALVPHVGAYIDQFYKNGITTKRFTIGDNKMGKYLLTPTSEK
jgi:hypothetical protein